MRFAILIVTYTSPVQTLRFVNSLNNGSFDFYIHLDKKIDIETHRDLFNIPNVYFVEPRIDVKWAGFSTAEAALSGVRFIRASGREYGFINLVSGQDYPIKPAAYIANLLKSNLGKEFMLYRYFDTEWQEAISRVTKYHFTDYTFPGKTIIEKTMNLLLPDRKWPLDLRLCGKETFWTLSPECAFYMVDFIDADEKLRKFLRLTWGSDEFIYHTIILGSRFKDRVVNKNYRYIHWPQGAARPKTLGSGDFESLMASEAIFARKLDINHDSNLFDLLDKANGTAAIN